MCWPKLEVRPRCQVSGGDGADDKVTDDDEQDLGVDSVSSVASVLLPPSPEESSLVI